ncbi:hypothetical protein D1AOALGA4SA_7359 [Olavius algarvensis Delta 1 endosymbiont]|nr:hypothetical protein D1AOALGA4SA_7359 [Olavius algarvensis Delta 1 endosymbiont]
MNIHSHRGVNFHPISTPLNQLSVTILDCGLRIYCIASLYLFLLK